MSVVSQHEPDGDQAFPTRPRRAQRVLPTMPPAPSFLDDVLASSVARQGASGEWVLRPELQEWLERLTGVRHRRDDTEGSPLYVGYRCQACWEDAVALLAYGHHLCREGSPPVRIRGAAAGP